VDDDDDDDGHDGGHGVGFFPWERKMAAGEAGTG